MKIIIDAMGGDNAPGEIVRGAVDAQLEFGVDIVLTGREEEVRKCLADCEAADNEHISVVNAEEVITMEDDPSTAVRRKRGSSMAVALTMLKNGEGDACVSAGSTGALLTGATLLVRRIRGIRRAALAPVIPNGEKGVMIIDAGANAECSEEYLLQFAYMGSFYAKHIMGCESPRIGLLNIGSEDTKGTDMRRAAFSLLKEASEAGKINFIGNVEGGDVFFDKADVIVTDGFSGNILLKGIEGTGKFIMKSIKSALTVNRRTKVAAFAARGGLNGVKTMMDASEVGGTAMLGISKPVIKAHGGSNARAIRSAVRQAIAFVDSSVIPEIIENIDDMRLHGGDDE